MKSITQFLENKFLIKKNIKDKHVDISGLPYNDIKICELTLLKLQEKDDYESHQAFEFRMLTEEAKQKMLDSLNYLLEQLYLNKVIKTGYKLDFNGYDNDAWVFSLCKGDPHSSDVEVLGWFISKGKITELNYDFGFRPIKTYDILHNIKQIQKELDKAK